MAKIFVSYRREDSAYIAAALREKIEQHFGKGSAYFDVDSNLLGGDYRQQIARAVSECDALLVIIGDKWTSVTNDENKLRLHDSNDLVRVEIESAFDLNLPVIPVLVGNAQIPRPEDLPESLQKLPYQHSAEVRAGRDLQIHLQRLVEDLDNAITRSTGKSRTGLKWALGFSSALILIAVAWVSWAVVIPGVSNLLSQYSTEANIYTLASLTDGSSIIQITSDPPGAMVSVAGIEIGQTPLIRDDMTPGTYDLSLTSRYHEAVDSTISIDNDLVFKQHYPLDPALGNLTVVSDPADAVISLNGTANGEVTPASLTQLDAGIYQIQLSKVGFQSKTVSDFEVLPNSTSLLSESLEKVWGLTVNAQPADASIVLPDLPQAYTPGLELLPGDYLIAVSAPYYESRTETVTIENSELTVEISLERSHFLLQVNTDPANAEVRLIGASENYRDGSTYLTPGRYEVEVSAEGFQTRREQLSLLDVDRTIAIALEKIIRFPLPEMIPIPAGRFEMGSNEGDEDEKPVHSVTIDYALALSETEVTFEQYDTYATATGQSLPEDEGWGRDSRPVINVSWDDIQGYIEWLNEHTAGGYRLPTEAEWEYAALAGSATEYSWGDDIGSNRANCDGCGSQWDNNQTATVGGFEANDFGLYDMHGNVWEWVQDCYVDSYEETPVNGSAMEDGSCEFRVLRGGSWFAIPRFLRSANRSRDAPSNRDYALGFRLAQDL